ncbi:MAG: hypothetical protein M3Q09_00415 [Gemmatimonadota bacterium]|nr:hypothetical protein [Gemmatimonadota bacterium]
MSALEEVMRLLSGEGPSEDRDPREHAEMPMIINSANLRMLYSFASR